MAEYRAISYALADNVATITLNRPDTLNSLNRDMRLELAHAFERAPKEGARAIVLTGAGRSFCSGQDLGEPGAAGLPDVERTLREEYEPFIHAMMNCDVPIIGAINGVAAGAGASLALLCDMVFAAHSASFVIAFARIGLVPDVAATYLLPRLIGLPRALGMTMTTEPVDGQRAEQWGLIWKAVPDDELAQTVQTQALQFAKGPTRSYALTRKTMRDGLSNDLAAQLALEARSQKEAADTRDFKEGAMAFLEKRAPNFEGR